MINNTRTAPQATAGSNPRQRPIFQRPKTKPKPAPPKDHALHQWCETRTPIVVRLTDGSTLAGIITSVEMFAIELAVSGRRVFVFKHAIVLVEARDDARSAG